MALGTARLPVLVDACPVKAIARTYFAAGIEMIPGLAIDIPGDIQDLQSAIPGLHQILLERPHTHRVGDLVFRQTTIRAIGFDEIFSTRLAEMRREILVG